MRFSMTLINRNPDVEVKKTDDPHRTEISIKGREVPEDQITVADMERVIEVEQWLEKIIGVRVHIFSDPRRTNETKA